LILNAIRDTLPPGRSMQNPCSLKTKQEDKTLCQTV